MVVTRPTAVSGKRASAVPRTTWRGLGEDPGPNRRPPTKTSGASNNAASACNPAEIAYDPNRPSTSGSSTCPDAEAIQCANTCRSKYSTPARAHAARAIQSIGVDCVLMPTQSM